MKRSLLLVCAAVVLAAVPNATPAAAQATPEAMVAAYEGLADSILGLRDAEAGFVRTVILVHHRAAKAAMKAGKIEDAAAQMAMVANEGDNAVAGIRKRLLEGGHHYNAEGEEQGIYEPGYVIVTREAKKEILEAASALRQAPDDAAREAAWTDYRAVVDKLLEE